MKTQHTLEDQELQNIKGELDKVRLALMDMGDQYQIWETNEETWKKEDFVHMLSIIAREGENISKAMAEIEELLS